MGIKISMLDRHDSDHDELFDVLTRDIIDVAVTGDNTITDVARHLRETGRWSLANAGTMLHIYEVCGFDLVQDGNTTRVTIL